MNNNPVAIRIKRNSLVEENIGIAMIKLGRLNHVTGQPVIVNYYKENKTVDTILAIGTKNGVGPDCYSIISTSGVTAVNRVLPELPDVSELVNGETYISMFSGKWALIGIDPVEQEHRVIGSLQEDKKYHDLSTGLDWYFDGETVKREDDFCTTSKTETLISNSFHKVYPIKVEVSGGSLMSIGEILSNPKISVSVSDYTGKSLTGDCKYKFFNETMGEQIQVRSKSSDTFILDSTLSSTTVIRIEAELEEGTETFTGTGRVEFVFSNPVLYGGLSEEDSLEPRNFLGLAKETYKGEGDLVISFNLKRQISVLAVPAEFPLFTKIKDTNGLDYTNDYSVHRNMDINGILYNVYKKLDPISINNFKQIFSYE